MLVVSTHSIENISLVSNSPATCLTVLHININSSEFKQELFVARKPFANLFPLPSLKLT